MPDLLDQINQQLSNKSKLKNKHKARNNNNFNNNKINRLRQEILELEVHSTKDFKTKRIEMS
jgi:hypothetical protein